MYLNISKTKLMMCIDFLDWAEVTQNLFGWKGKWLTELVHVST